MTLVDLKQYFQQVRMASLATISVYFNRKPEVIRGMLSHWIQKGCLRKCLKTQNCGINCMKCSPAATEMYEWVAIA